MFRYYTFYWYLPSKEQTGEWHSPKALTHGIDKSVGTHTEKSIYCFSDWCLLILQFSLSANVLITLVIAMVLEQVCAEWFCGFINHHQALKKPHSYEEICSSNRKDLRVRICLDFSHRSCSGCRSQLGVEELGRPLAPKHWSSQK